MKLCDECNLRPANIHLTQINENETQSFHLCEECAQKQGIRVSIDEEATGTVPVSPEPSTPDRECPSCGTGISLFRGSGLLGCPACYAAFEGEIEDRLMQSHGTVEHKGKPYGRGAVREPERADVSQLRSELEMAIRNEEFERAAELRDALHGLTNTEIAKAQ